MGAVITLTTDFGLADGYVAAVKGVMLGINPRAQLVDICHSIKPQDISQAAFVLGTACEFFPRRTVHLVVVDPGVGTERRAVIVRTPEADFVAPDNGVLSYVIRRYSLQDRDESALSIKPGPDLEAVSITKPRFWRSQVSATFHGRDIFAPVAAHLSLGVPPADFGEPVDSLCVLPPPLSRRETDGSLVGHIIHIDTFGNLITSIRKSDLHQDVSDLTVEVKGRRIRGLSRTYADGEGLLALAGSSGYLEIALRDGDAGAFLSARTGDEVRLYQAM